MQHLPTEALCADQPLLPGQISQSHPVVQRLELFSVSGDLGTDSRPSQVDEKLRRWAKSFEPRGCVRGPQMKLIHVCLGPLEVA